MKRRLEYEARAALCRHFAELEPRASYIWLAESERWLRLAREPIVTEKQKRRGSIAGAVETGITRVLERL